MAGPGMAWVTVLLGYSIQVDDTQDSQLLDWSLLGCLGDGVTKSNDLRKGPSATSYTANDRALGKQILDRALASLRASKGYSL